MAHDPRRRDPAAGGGEVMMKPIDIEEAKRLRAEEGMGLAEAVRLLRMRALLEAATSAKTVDDLREVLIALIKRLEPDA